MHTRYHINLLVRVSSNKRVDARLERGGVEHESGHIPEQDALLRKVWDSPDAIRDQLFGCLVSHVSQGGNAKMVARSGLLA